MPANDDTRGRIRDRLQDINDMVADVDALLDELPADASKLREANDVVDVGEERTVMVHDPGEGTKHGDPMTKIDGLVVFLNAAGLELQPGEMVDIRISEVESTLARAIVISRAEEGDGDAEAAAVGGSSE